ncbi:hypothetical protein [Nocardiopsis chromatogenes]|uniref:hypothetical protein n=1 Tax=Nocardiopsis chromatogenes TaxID=280239 RepID=UPI001268911E|nr:hypothetical protein [Nocardiopsis chromatogenes]
MTPILRGVLIAVSAAALALSAAPAHAAEDRPIIGIVTVDLNVLELFDIKPSVTGVPVNLRKV